MRVLFFDLDGTLMVNPFGPVVFPTITADLAAQAGQTPAAILALIVATHDARLAEPFPDRARGMDWDDMLAEVAAQLGVKLHHSAETLVREHAAPPHTRFLDNAPNVLRQLKPGRRLVVASMGLSKFQVPVLHALGLYDFFDDFLLPDTTAAFKTEAAFYARYAEAETRIHIGDRYDHDCFYPAQFGAQTVLRVPSPELSALTPFERPNALHKLTENLPGAPATLDILPDAVIIHLDELLDVIPALEARHKPKKRITQDAPS
ncbi:MAG: HAD family hydrolase [Anaerolineales bacterium]